jgi:signal transduction histidine kinase
MTFRSRLLVTFLLAVLLPMIALALFVRGEMTDRLTAQYERRVEAMVEVIEGDLAQEGKTITASLTALCDAVVDDNRFRRAAVDRAAADRRYLLDYAGDAMRLTGLSMLQIQDETGRIVSSGHFRNEYDRMEPELPRLLASTPGGTALVSARAPDAPFLALARVDSFRMGGRRFDVVAGVEVERRFLDRLAREDELTVALVYPGGMLVSRAGGDQPGTDEGASTAPDRDDAIVQELDVPFIDVESGELAVAQFWVAHQLDELHALRGSIDRWILIAVVVTALLAIVLVGWLASRVSRPLAELADKTSRIDLDRLDIDFDTSRNDEIGALSRLLGSMTGRLRASAVRIRDAERRATLGELARQVNHDIKNGLVPIRNVFRHLIQLARSTPGQLPEVFEERQGTLDSSINYLENLASNYARLYPRSECRPCDVNAIVESVVTDLREPERNDNLKMRLCDKAVVLGDPLSLRRVLENLVDNAVDSMETKPGEVVVSTEVVAAGGEDGYGRVRMTVSDTGAGMTEEQRTKVFDDFYTTKDEGTGLGLSIVHRLVMDMDGSVGVESEPGKGSRFIVDLPAAGEEQER